MKNHRLTALALSCAFAALMSGSASTQTVIPAGAAVAQDPLAARRMGPWGFDLEGRDLSAKPGADFYRYAVGGSTDRLVIPADRSRWGAFNQLRDLSDARGRAIIEKAASGADPSPKAAQVGALYNSFMDEARVEALGVAPLAANLAAIRAADTRPRLAVLMGKAASSYHGAFFGPHIAPDQRVPGRYAVYVNQAGLGLPDRDYYLKPEFEKQKTAYRAYVAATLRSVAWPDAERRATEIVALETAIATVSWTRVDQRDDVKMYNPKTRAQLIALAPQFPWTEFLKAAGLGGHPRFIVGEVTAFPKIAAIFGKTPVGTLQAWQAFTTTDNAAPYLSRTFADQQFEFRGKVLTGQLEERARWKRGVAVVDNHLGEAVGKLYVDAYFPPESKRQMEDLVKNLRAAMKGRIERADWMSAKTKTEALVKLAKFNVKIGYPDKWRDYSRLVVRRDDLFGNVERGVAFDWNYQLSKLPGPIDKTEWHMTPQTVNAYYDSTQNEIVFPAAILQPPFFDPKADPAVNYGGIGGVIGHEITHGFDDQGRQSDGDGQLRDWWTADDAARFTAQAKKLGDQFSAYEPLPGAHINGDLTMGENIADLGGVVMAYDAYMISLSGKPAPVIDGYTGPQRFFLAWAQVWQSKTRDEALRQQLVSDPHSPGYYRANGPLKSIDAFYEAFGLQPGDAMFIPPEQRVRIW